MKTRQILKGVILSHKPDTTYVDGMEDDLELEMTAAQCKRLEETGSIAGDWSPKGTEHVMSSARPDKKGPAPKPAKVDVKVTEPKPLEPKPIIPPKK